MSFQEIIAGIGGLGLATTKSVDLVRNFIGEHFAGWHVPKYVWNLLPFAIGVYTAVQTNLDLLAGQAWAANMSQLAKQVLTGLIIGGAAGLGHEGLDLLSSAAKKQKVAVTVEEAKQVIVDDPDGDHGEEIE